VRARGGELRKTFFASSGSEGVRRRSNSPAPHGRVVFCMRRGFPRPYVRRAVVDGDPFWRVGFGPMLVTLSSPFAIGEVGKTAGVQEIRAFFVEPIQERPVSRSPPNTEEARSLPSLRNAILLDE